MKNDIRILVEGSRGKSGLVRAITDLLYARGEDAVGKITGKETIIFRKGKKINVQRKHGKNFLLDQENKEILKKYNDVTFKIFENQALSCYTMKVVHNIVKPQIIVIPNIRFEHQDSLGEDIEEIAKSFAFNFKGTKKVITTENKKIVLDIFNEYCKKFNVELIVIDSYNEEIPSISSIKLIDRVLKEVGVNGLSKEEIKYLGKNIITAMSIKYSKSQKIDYYNGAKVNDPESSANVFNYLKKHNPNKRFVFVCYLRGDRPERTESFLIFFESICKDNRVERIYFNGSGLKHIKDDTKIIKKKNLTHKEVIDFCKEKNLVLFMAVNGVNEFMQELERILEN